MAIGQLYSQTSDVWQLSELCSKLAAHTQNLVISDQRPCTHPITTLLLAETIITAEPAVRKSALPQTPPAE